MARHDEAEQRLLAVASKFASDIDVATAFALVAMAKEDWIEARCRWDRVLALKPDSELAMSQRRFALWRLGKSTEDQANWSEALEIWKVLSEEFPNHPAGIIGVGRALSKMSLFDDAEKALSSALTGFPDDLEVAIASAQVAMTREDWPEALGRWNRVLSMQPENALAIPQRRAVLWHIARTAERRASLGEALQKWETLWQEYPDHPAGITGVARMLSKMARYDEAEGRLWGAVNKFPGDFGVLNAFAQLATDREDWEEAVTRWNRVLVANPHHDLAISRRGIALWHVEQSAAVTPDPDPAHSSRGATIAEIERVTDAAARGLVMKYESWGENCEFGLVQRHFEAEPVGLLRWVYCPADMLITLLEQQFRGLGDLENLRLSRTKWNEYFIKDTKYGITFHTFSYKDIVDEPMFMRQQSRRISYLANELLASLQEGNNRVVYKTGTGIIDAQIQRIYSLLQQYSANNKFLYVSVTSNKAQAGTILSVDSGFMHGKISRENPTRTQQGDVWDIPYDEWRSILEKAESI